MSSAEAPVSRVLSLRTTVLVGLGVAIGSGILRTPPLVAGALGHPMLILLAWTVGGLIILASSLIMAELATRLPESGGEYAWLREAYGPFVAFFFGWGYTVFVVGGGAATIAAAFGDAMVELLGRGSARVFAALAVAAVTLANMLGLRTGAALQNLLTFTKVAIVVSIGAVSVAVGFGRTAPSAPAVLGAGASIGAWIAALAPVIWAYAGSTDAVKLGGEVKDPERALPRALLLATLSLTVIYVGANGALLWALGVDGLSRSTLPASDVALAFIGSPGRALVAAASAVVFLGALSSTLLATVRVAWALGRDGYGFAFLGRMSARQAPVGALAFVGAIAFVLALVRDFEEILGLYFLASAILFGLVYASLLVLRRRDGDGPPPPGVFRCPLAPWLVALMLLVQTAMAALVVVHAPYDAAATLGLLAFVAAAWTLRGRSAGRE